MQRSTAPSAARGGASAGVLLSCLQAEGVSDSGWSGVGHHRRPAPALGPPSGGWCGAAHTGSVGHGHGRWGARLAAALGASV